jgi:MFS family permease
VPNIYKDLTGSSAGILVVVWINGIMYLLRQFGGGFAHKISPVKLIAITSVFAAAGLWMYVLADKMQSTTLWYVAAAVFAVGVAYWWPSMLGITSERFPRGGALALAVIGGTGSISTAVGGPVMGWINDKFGPNNVLPIWSALPIVLIVVFTLLHLADKARGGYKAEQIVQQNPAK